MKTLMKLRKEVSHGGEIPPGWQMARHEPRRRVGVYYSAPLHWLAGVLHEVINRVHRERLAPANTSRISNASGVMRCGVRNGRAG
jgi:hypothetical protein